MEGSEQRDAREGTRALLYGWCQIESPCRGPRDAVSLKARRYGLWRAVGTQGVPCGCASTRLLSETQERPVWSRASVWNCCASRDSCDLVAISPQKLLDSTNLATPGWLAVMRVGMFFLPLAAAFSPTATRHTAMRPAAVRIDIAPAASAAMPALQGKAMLLAAKGAVPFTLLGKTSSELFAVQNLSLLSWALYLLLPRWRFTPVLALVAPVLHSALYSKVLVHMIQNPTPGLTVDFSSLAGIMPGFALPDGAFAGWLHYCAFDPLVGLAIVLDAKRLRVPHLLCVPCLAATAFMGPVGFLSYLILRSIVRVWRGSVKISAPKGFEWGKTY